MGSPVSKAWAVSHWLLLSCRRLCPVLSTAASRREAHGIPPSTLPSAVFPAPSPMCGCQAGAVSPHCHRAATGTPKPVPKSPAPLHPSKTTSPEPSCCLLQRVMLPRVCSGLTLGASTGAGKGLKVWQGTKRRRRRMEPEWGAGPCLWPCD